MRRVASLLVVAASCALVAGSLAWVQAAEEGGRRGLGMMGGRGGSFLGLLGEEKVQKELKLSAEQIEKVKAAGEKVRGELEKDSAGLRDIQDQAQRRAKMTELADKADQQAREQLRDVLTQEQWMRLYQIRLQVRGLAVSLKNPRVAERLKLTDEQKTKAAEIEKAMGEKSAEAFGGLRDLSQDDRRAKMGEVRDKLRKIRSEADEKALELLTPEQKENLDKMKGEKFELTREE
ncbi:MAG: Spy/CpxP family protein refolding chaperone [Pirellulales bacterium]